MQAPRGGHISYIVPRLYYQDIDRESGKSFLRPATMDDLMQISVELARKNNAVGCVLSGMKDITKEIIG